MSLQFISDTMGKTTGVYIPIEEWNALKKKYKNLEEGMDIPEWHQAIVRERMAEYELNPDNTLDFDDAMDEIEKDL